ncbi:DHA1 family bicyclomycin/chloramphenicol resistance-like MFS transporter [Haloactinospora alba]|uniref:DHA1 family bicyclomycin/chloramphenicol resistance-like MFS transporter n=1 Tax=Haloactinospora alba TaxID=405555 RepID=A0A543NID7_9ACTN|nr:Bcr/CflA family efflux MFS transporter [Haloactinospora alba]TQN31608.1 DHA1 family bicyclomycin/chloramphenicol resistance-like MFS transporter [Haloactinospora alba]
MALLVLVLGALTATGPLSTDLYLPAFPQIARDLNAPESQIQLTLTAIMLGLGVGQLVIGPLSDGLGRRLPLLLGVTVFTVTTFACMLAPSAPVLVALRFVQGVAGAAGAVIARAVVRDLFEGDHAARFFTRLMLVTGMAPLLGPILGGQLLLLGPWQLTFGVIGGVSTLTLVVVFFWLPESLPRSERREMRPAELARTVGALLRDARFVGPALTLGLSFGMMFTYVSSFSFVSQNQFGATAQQFSLIFAVNTLGIIIGTQLNGFLIGRVETARRLAAGLTGALVAVVTMSLLAATGSAGLLSLTVVFFGMMFSVGFVFPNATTLAISSQPPAVAGTASALMGSMQFALGGGLAALAGLTATGEATLASMAVVMVSVGAASAVVFAVLGRSAARSVS